LRFRVRRQNEHSRLGHVGGRSVSRWRNGLQV
jgi:translation initiation factor IF-1